MINKCVGGGGVRVKSKVRETIQITILIQLDYQNTNNISLELFRMVAYGIPGCLVNPTTFKHTLYSHTHTQHRTKLRS